MNAWVIGVLVLLVLAVAILLWRWLHRRDQYATPTPYGGKPSHTTDAMWWLWQELQKLEPSSQLGGTFASKPGYHNYRNALPSYDYSVCDRPPDDGGPGDVCAAIDWTFPNAQRGDYSTISKYTRRLIDSGRDPDDPRMNGWRECYGQADNDNYVEGYDFRYQRDVTSDSSHLWHIHLSECRDQATSMDNKKAVLSVLKGETVDEWLGVDAVRGDGVVLLNCPYDANRQDLLYVGSDGTVRHNWWTGGVNTPWSKKTSTENLGGAIEVGTLTAAWTPDGNSINIAGLGKGDANCPDGSGQYWGMNLQRGGTKSGWGSFEGMYGKLPDGGGTTLERTSSDHSALVIAACAVLLAIFAIVFVAWGPR